MQHAANGLILPSQISEAFKPFTYQIPAGLLPIVNKPIMEHQVEYLVRSGIKNIRISCNHLTNKVEAYFGNGSRWGAQIACNYERPPFGFVSALRQMRSHYDGETLVILQSDVVPGFDLNGAMELHWSRRADATFVCYTGGDPVSGLTVLLDENARVHGVGSPSLARTKPTPVEVGICILEPEVLDLIPDIIGHNLLQACWIASQSVKLNLFGFQTSDAVARVTNWSSYVKVQNDILAGRFAGIRIPGIELQPGVWVGKNINASSNVSFEAPLVIGDNCRIGKGVTLGKGTIIGHDVMVDVGAKLHNAVILSKTFVGSQTEIHDAIIQGNLMVDLKKESFLPIEDGLAATEILRPKTGFKFYIFFNKLLAALLYVLLSPILLILFFLMIVGLKFPLRTRVKRIAPDLGELSVGKLRLRVFDLVYLGPADLTKRPIGHNPDPLTALPHLLARIGNLTNVMRGDILLVGNRPMDPEIAFSITEEYRRTRLKCQGGVVSILDTNEVDETTEEEQIISEGYYAVNRTLGMDISILMRGLWRLFWRMLGARKVVREYVQIAPEETPSYE
jgi:NDP-sugar pyrophosphorylase family protein